MRLPYAAGFLIVLLLAASASEEVSASEQPDAARWIADMNTAMLSAENLRAVGRLETRDHLGAGRNIEFILHRRTRPAAVATVLEVTAPPAGRGTIYQVVARENQPLERWVYLPEIDRLRKLVGFKRSDPFLGTEFGYEDLEWIVPDERGVGRAEWIEEAGKQIVRVVSEPYHAYERVETWIDPATKLPVRTEFYDRAGQLWKIQSYSRVGAADGHAIPTRVTMRDVQSGAQSMLELVEIETHAAAPEALFAENEIERRIREKDDRPRR